MTSICIENFNSSKIYDNPTVSFIVPAYNAERTIERCIRSCRKNGHLKSR